MKGGFSFCGVDIFDIGLEYAPENKDTYVYAPAESNIHEETFEGHDGGYSYGASKQPKVFTLRCYYEEKHIAQGVLAKTLDLFRVGRKGMLIFKRRPWCYYYATVTANPDISQIYNYLNGVVTITMKAYYPYARGYNVTDDANEDAAHKHLFYSEIFDPHHFDMMKNTAILDKAYMVPDMTFNNISSQKSIILYNPGTEKAKVDIIISGTAGNGVTIYNNATQQSCKYVAFNTNNNDYIYTDGINGKTVLDSDGNKSLAFLYHDHGFIELEPAFPILRDLYVSYNNSLVVATNILYQEEGEKEWYIGKYIYIGIDSFGDWYKINKCIDKHTLELTKNTQMSGICKTSIVSMNEITITPTQGTSLKRLSFIYKPTYS